MSKTIHQPASLLADLPDSSLWTSLAWTDFARMSEAQRRRTVVVLPLFGFADWGLGRPLDLEETVGTAVLRAALAAPQTKKIPLLVAAPLRWVLGPYPHSVFGIDFETAFDVLREIATSVKAAGFRKLALFNTSPWNEELADAGGRDLRVELGLQTFCVNLAALDLDLHPVRSTTRTSVQCVATALTGALPSDDTHAEDVAAPDFRPGNIRQPGSLRFTLPLDQARARGEKLLAASGRHLAALLGEIHARPPLARDGAIPAMRAPAAKRKPAKTQRRGKRR